MATERTKTAIERENKEVEMQKLIEALENFNIERVTDNGTLAYMIPNGELEGRFITIKVVLTKELDEETGKGFDINDAIAEYNEKITKAAAKEAERIAKANAKAAKTKKSE